MGPLQTPYIIRDGEFGVLGTYVSSEFQGQGVPGTYVDGPCAASGYLGTQISGDTILNS